MEAISWVLVDFLRYNPAAMQAVGSGSAVGPGNWHIQLNCVKSYGNFAENREFFLLDKVVKVVGGRSVIKGAYPV